MGRRSRGLARHPHGMGTRPNCRGPRVCSGESCSRCKGGYARPLKISWAQPLPGEGDNHHTPVPGGVRAIGVHNATVTNCTFEKMGGSGFDILGGSKHSVVKGCFVSDISGAGKFRCQESWSRGIPKDSLLWDCLVITGYQNYPS